MKTKSAGKRRPLPCEIYDLLPAMRAVLPALRDHRRERFSIRLISGNDGAAVIWLVDETKLLDANPEASLLWKSDRMPTQQALEEVRLMGMGALGCRIYDTVASKSVQLRRVVNVRTGKAARNLTLKTLSISVQGPGGKRSIIRCWRTKHDAGGPAMVRKGDLLYWDRDYAYWTPRGQNRNGPGKGETYDIRLRRSAPIKPAKVRPV
jgi:hypothetical protein